MSFINYEGIPVKVASWLPYPATAKACDIETRMEIDYLTSEKVHAVIIDCTWFMSHELYDVISKPKESV